MKLENFYIKNNIFDRSTHCILQINATKEKSLPKLCGNKYVHNKGGIFGRYDVLPSNKNYNEVQTVYDGDVVKLIESIDESSEVYFI